MSSLKRKIIGTMTGTSIDGIDVCLIEVLGKGLSMTVNFVSGVSVPFDENMRGNLKSLADQVPMTAGDVASLSYAFANLHIQAISKLLEQISCSASELDLIVAHGQTVFHAPPLSWQLFSPAPVAHAFQVPVVFDMRAADLAAGGEGAPITPLADWVIFKDIERTEMRAIVNLGGFCNVTILNPDCSKFSTHGISGGDVCACNHLLDTIARARMGSGYDLNGNCALAGVAVASVVSGLERILQQQATSKRSLGTEDLPHNWLDEFVATSTADLARSACAALARIICNSINAHAGKIILAGGGVNNRALLKEFSALRGEAVVTAHEFGMDPTFREAAEMAVLGALCQDRVPITVSAVTKVKSPEPMAGHWCYPTYVDPINAASRQNDDKLPQDAAVAITQDAAVAITQDAAVAITQDAAVAITPSELLSPASESQQIISTADSEGSEIRANAELQKFGSSKSIKTIDDISPAHETIACPFPSPPDRSHILTEQRNPHSMSLHNLSVEECVGVIQSEDRASLMDAMDAAGPSLCQFISSAEPGFLADGRLIYLGAGTSGRLGVLDASEAPPTFHVPPGKIIGIIAGGDSSLRKSSEGAEDDRTGAVAVLDALNIGREDSVVGIAAGGTTPYVLGALAYVGAYPIGRRPVTCLITCTPLSVCPMGVDHVITLAVGAEVLSGSTRMKAGTATKLALNTISTTLMVRMGKVYENLMVDMRASNSKLKDRAARIISSLTGLDRNAAFALLAEAGGACKTAVVMHRRILGRDEAEDVLLQAGGRLSLCIDSAGC